MERNRMVIVSSVLILIVLFGSLVIFLFTRGSEEKKDTSSKQELVLKEKNTEKLVSPFEYKNVELNPEYEGKGVEGVKSVEEYKSLIAENSTVLSNGITPLKGERLVEFQSLLKEAVGEVPFETSKGTSTPAKSDFVRVVNRYFGKYEGNPLQTIDFLLLYNHLEVTTANFYSTDEKDTYAFEFLFEDDKGNQLAYVTGYISRFSMKFKPSYVLVLGYGQGFINENLPKSQPPSMGT